MSLYTCVFSKSLQDFTAASESMERDIKGPVSKKQIFVYIVHYYCCILYFLCTRYFLFCVLCFGIFFTYPIFVLFYLEVGCLCVCVCVCIY